MEPTQFQNVLILVAIAGFALMEFASRRYQATVHATANDTKLELFMFVSLVALTQPLVILATQGIGATWFAQWQGMWADWPWWAMFGVLLLGDDLTQYLWHRASHSPLLWPLHRAHHSAQYMSVRMTFRNNFFYYLMMPGLWIAGALLFLGFGGWVYAIYLGLKLTIILGAHCSWRWDEPLYKIRALRPVMWVVERTISTPATHWAHHALTNKDGIGHYTGNFGNMLFLWDVLFGTAHITRKYPSEIGLMDDRIHGQEHWAHQMFFPVVQSRRADSALKFGGTIYDENKPQLSGVQVADHHLD
ncbi:sterol desaturase/sphingolipid hydroxylase (fatty acid hydroxylase superfamily) [Limnobacter thiooxidans]|nr:sterol desaturase/sphingolipid hydroxylase (fatty acid hydroxylase superfamily) [Limnobacter thiooxidans]